MGTEAGGGSSACLPEAGQAPPQVSLLELLPIRGPMHGAERLSAKVLRMCDEEAASFVRLRAGIEVAGLAALPSQLRTTPDGPRR